MSLENNILKLKSEGKTHKEVMNLLNISKSTVCHYCLKNGLNFSNTKVNDDLIIKIKKLTEKYTIKDISKICGISISTVKRYKDTTSTIKLSHEQLKENNKKIVTRTRQRLKLKAIDYKGGACVCCGYNKSVRSMHFHHIDPTQKDFSIGGNGATRSWEKIKTELDKCVLVCSNCHGEIHDEIDVLGYTTLIS
jgi:DNA-binding CsgD family transcriptional regulator